MSRNEPLIEIKALRLRLALSASAVTVAPLYKD